ncbi:Phosphatidylinositol N-acetylglucosaminyltransferase subunit P [Babesia sp. Xinjiang]|uniref:Phosphatidylinositol N-acetylglucosaminyltransferase subunit P n=1 Tax=Babesia sp. Xinjiang TaxID=462227 RepID=UPI000A23948B|nr:Phosphatidylinositol N-acetylglucosaminyltransferase subunit P [Babesia sp. Xinjiang]ORM39924.1 Phosphatidylinositol N-acetylglucosaminyltransferase subunit P [Babesia sp. Xinjiang]
MEKEIKAFVALILSHLGIGLYFLWALTPERIIKAYGITYYPSKHWAVAMPASIMLIVSVTAFYWLLSERSMLPPLDSRASFVDPVSHPDHAEESLKNSTLHDIALATVNKKLYG